jgi:tRNA threonylcarbamoyladenosine biosynthesis protein TsaB
MAESKLLLGIDTCGPSGSVALGRLNGGDAEILGQTELAGRSYSATLVAAIGDLLAQAGTQINLLHAIVAVNGPGSFTGVRVGLSAVKGLAEALGIPVVAVSRLEVLARKARAPSDGSSSLELKAGEPSSALDAQRGEVFLRIAPLESSARELLAGPRDLAALNPAPERIAVCEPNAAVLLGSVWPRTEILRAPAPTAADALRLCAARVARGEFVDVAMLDGHYLRRSDAEIFSPLAPAGSRRS